MEFSNKNRKYTEGFHGTSVENARSILEKGFDKKRGAYFALTINNPRLIESAIDSQFGRDGPKFYAAIKAEIPPTRIFKGGYQGRLEVPKRKVGKITVSECRIYRFNPLKPDEPELVGHIPIRGEEVSEEVSRNEGQASDILKVRSALDDFSTATEEELPDRQSGIDVSSRGKDKVGVSNQLRSFVKTIGNRLSAHGSETSEANLDRTTLDNIFQEENYSPKALIEFFKRKFSSEYEAYAGVGKDMEGKDVTIERHTEWVLSQFDQYFSEKPLPLGMDVNLFRVMLALHDIGKPKAIRKGDKSSQHKYTGPMVAKTLNELGYSARERDLAVAVVSGDPIGECIQAEQAKDAASQEIIRKARRLNVPVQDLLNLMLTFYLSDAGSYTSDAGSMPVLDLLFAFDREHRSLKLAAEPQGIVDQLKEKISK